MNFPIVFDTVKSGWSIIYSERSQVIIFKTLYFFSENQSLYAAFHFGPHCLPKYPFWGFLVSKGLSECKVSVSVTAKILEIVFKCVTHITHVHDKLLHN